MFNSFKNPQVYKKQFNINSSFSPLGNTVFKVWIQQASLWRSNRSLLPPLFGAFTISMPWNLKVQMSCFSLLKCLATGDFSSFNLILLLCSIILVFNSLFLSFADVTKNTWVFQKVDNIFRFRCYSSIYFLTCMRMHG